jgi:hypothetical protein
MAAQMPEPSPHIPTPPPQDGASLILPPPADAPVPSQALAQAAAQHGAAGLRGVAAFAAALGRGAGICWEQDGEKREYPADLLMQDAWRLGGSPLPKADTERTLHAVRSVVQQQENQLDATDEAIADLAEAMTGDRVRPDGSWDSAAAMAIYLRERAIAVNAMVAAMTDLLWDVYRDRKARLDGGTAVDPIAQRIEDTVGKPPETREP